MNKEPRLIITVPHSKRDPSLKVRHYDLRAEEAAAVLKSAAQRLYPSLEVIVYLSDTLRAECDLNRDECLKNKWRQNLYKEIRPHDYHIDCHSFPNTMESFTIVGDRPADEVKELLDMTAPQVLFLYNNDSKEYVESLAGRLAPAGVMLLRPDPAEIIVSILRQSAARRKVLIEWNEDTTILNREEMENLASDIIKAMIFPIEDKIGGKVEFSRGQIIMIVLGLLLISILIIFIIYKKEEWNIPPVVIAALTILFIILPF